MQQSRERVQNSPVLLALLGLIVLVGVATIVFAVGNLLTGGDDDGEALDAGDTNTTTATSADGSDSSDNTDSTEASGSSSDSVGDLDGQSSSDDQDSDNGSDESTTTSTNGGGSSSSATAPPGASDFCEAATRNNFDIKFDNGESSTSVDAETPSDEVDLYQLDVSSAQILNVSIISRDLDLRYSVMAPDGSVMPGSFEGSTIAPTQAGTYQICMTPGDADTSYTLAVSVIDDNSPTKIDAPWCGDSVNDRGEIRFAAGTFSGTVDNGVIRGERDLYRFDASESQDVELFMTSLEENAVFSFRAPGGEILIDEVSDFRLPLPETGTYLVCVGGTRGNASYELTLTIG